MKIVADPNIPFVREAFSALGEIQFVAGRQINASAVRDADMLLVRSVTPVNAALLDNSKVRFVATATIGTDHVDQAYLRERGIGFASADGSNANSVAEYVVAAMLEIAHRNQFRLRDKTLGVVGVGNVGRRVVRYAEALGMRVLQNDPPRERMERSTSRHPARDRGAGRAARGDGQPGGLSLPQFVSLDRLLAEADIITLHVPLTRVGQASSLPNFLPEDATFHLFDKDSLAASGAAQARSSSTPRAAPSWTTRRCWKPSSTKKLSGVVLDVWEGEPNIRTDLLAAVDLGTPHIAGYSFDGKVNGTRMIYRAACEFFKLNATWQPQLPPPPVPQLEVAAAPGENDEDVLRRVIKHVYDITADDAALRKIVQRPRWNRGKLRQTARRVSRPARVLQHGVDAARRRRVATAEVCGFGVPVVATATDGSLTQRRRGAKTASSLPAAGLTLCYSIFWRSY